MELSVMLAFTRIASTWRLAILEEVTISYANQAQFLCFAKFKPLRESLVLEFLTP